MGILLCFEVASDKVDDDVAVLEGLPDALFILQLEREEENLAKFAEHLQFTDVIWIGTIGNN